ncbi:MAG TPA: hypothetical protein VMW87_08915 [Spirochaetia bacterium]|nr:hypothetical protein [Spirochaetia bacterium]
MSIDRSDAPKVRILSAAFTLFLLLSGLTYAPDRVAAESVWDQTYGFYVDIPEGWKLVDGADPAHLSFSDPTGQAVFQVFRYAGNRYPSAAEMARDIKSKLHADGDQAPFTYNGRDAMFCDFTFDAQNVRVRGYDLFIVGEDADYALLTYAPVDVYPDFHDWLLSAADSFSSGDEGLLFPGPVSQFYRPLQTAAVVSPSRGSLAAGSPTVKFRGGAALKLSFTKDDGEANQIVIEREARILASYQMDSEPVPQWKKAWGRYYRMIYRDTYHRFDGIAKQISALFDAANMTKPQMATELLAWLQDFSYTKTNTLSDLESPVSCVLSQTGDCDALGLTYAILLHHLQIGAVLMVSVQYSHSMVGVDIPGLGARFSFDGTQYLVAELTAPVAIGTIDQQMANPAGWIGIRLTAKP